ncbi:hypothetical protein [Paenibacillus campi]|uniref:hypothetical protein n=1 Tax=Paenibacillus campi TaxID=3106031 RepID=UPI002AFFFE7C|nr:hypothetical protein [Paenibacillus sp. SGZ-1014]
MLTLLLIVSNELAKMHIRWLTSDKMNNFEWILQYLIYNRKMAVHVWLERLNQTDLMTMYLSWIIILAVLLTVACLVWRVLVWLLYNTFPRLYEKIDLLKLDYIYRNKQWKLPVIWTAIFCLYNQGMITLQSRLQNSGDRAIDLTFLRVQYDPNILTSDEQYLIHWLFNKSGGSTFAARSIAGPDLSHASHRSRLFYYRARLDMLYSRLCTWSALVSKRYRLRSRKRYEFQRKVSFIIGIMVALAVPLLLFIDYDLKGNVILPTLDKMIVICLTVSLFMLIISGISFFLLLRHIGSTRQNTLKVTILKLLPTVVVFIYVTVMLCLRPNEVGLLDSSTIMIVLVTFICLVFGYVFPIVVTNVPLGSFKRRLSQGAYRKVVHPGRLERLLQASIILECGYDFLKTHPQIEAMANEYAEYPMLLQAERIISAKHIVFESQLEFEKYDIERRYEDVNQHQRSNELKYASDNTYVSNSYSSYYSHDSDHSCHSHDSSCHSNGSSHHSSSSDSDGSGNGDSNST